MSLRPFLNNISDIYSLWGKLPTGVREGSTAIQKPDLFGEENGYYCNNGKRQMDFLSAMHYFSKMDAPHVIKAFDLNEFDTICDLGGESYYKWMLLQHFFLLEADFPTLAYLFIGSPYYIVCLIWS